MIRSDPISYEDAFREWYEYERDGRHAGEEISYAVWKTQYRHREIAYVCQNSREMIRATLEPKDRSLIRMGGRGRIVTQWHEENEKLAAQGSERHKESISYFRQLTSLDAPPINSKGMLVLMKPGAPELFVIEGFHRSSIWCALCERGQTHVIRVNLAIP